MEDLRTIEIVTGEVSGIGLVDVLAIYTALWAIDIEYLIGMLDEDSLTRLSEDPDFKTLVTEDVQAQVNNPGRVKITESLTKFEEMLSNILSFSDKILEQNNKSPRKGGRKGSIK